MNGLIKVMVIGVLFVFPICANADIIGDVSLKVSASSPTGIVYFPSTSGNYYLDYDVSLNGGSLTEAFCVEDANASSTTQQYTLISIDNGLSDFGLPADSYLLAALVANNFLADQTEAAKAAAQIAVWEIIFDYDGTAESLNLATGDFHSTAYQSAAQQILDSLPSTAPTTVNGWALAVNPTITTGDIITEPYQNYLVQVPEPGLIILLGIAVSAIGVLYRTSKP